MNHRKIALALAVLLLVWLLFLLVGATPDIRDVARWYFALVQGGVVAFLVWFGFTGAGVKGRTARVLAFGCAALAAVSFAPELWESGLRELLGISGKSLLKDKSAQTYFGVSLAYRCFATVVCSLFLLYAGLRRSGSGAAGARGRGPNPVATVLCGSAAMSLGIGSLFALFFAIPKTGEEAWYHPALLLPALVYSILMAAGGRVAGGRPEWLAGGAAGVVLGVLRGPLRSLAGVQPLGSLLVTAFDCTVVGVAGGVARGRVARAIGGAFGGAVGGIAVALGSRYMRRPSLPDQASFGQWLDMLGPQLLAGVITGAIIWTLIVLGERVADGSSR